jgi:hypothetical protein
MGKTFDQSLIDTANIPMSMIDPEDMEDNTSEEFISMRRVQQGCHSELSNREDFPFNKFTKTIQTSKGQSTYSLPEGRIVKVRIANGNSIYELKYDADISMKTESSSMPELFTVTYNPNKIKLYPIPDKNYNISIDYISTKNVLLTDNTNSYIIEVGSTLRMPEQFQHLYFDALEYYVLATNMRKQSNPRWQPTLEIFREKWKIFLNGCRTVESETRFTI